METRANGKTRKYVVVAKVPLARQKTVLLRISDGGGMMLGKTSETIDFDTGTIDCNLVEGQELQGITDGKIIDPACLSCFFHGLVCQTSA